MTIGMAAPEYGVRPGSLGYLEVTDMFCGAGGSSLGLEHVPGLVVTQCINHDALCIEAHNYNFPGADHDYQDIWSTPAKRFRRTPVLWASPSCTHHAFCRGPKSEDEDAQKSRATMWCVCRFAEHHKYDAIIVENVIEARLWCEEHEKCNCGATFNQWFAEMEKLGYTGQLVYFNSQFALPTPQSRDRMYVVFWRHGIRKPNLDFRPAAWCSDCEMVVNGIQSWKVPTRNSSRTKPGMYEWGRYGAQYVYTCPNQRCGAQVAPAVVGAYSAIDMNDKGQRIGDRAYKDGRSRPLKPNTRKRIRVGLENLGQMRPATVQVGGNLYERNGYARVWSVDDPMKALTTTNYTALVVPNKDGCVAGGDYQPLPTVTTRTHIGVVVRAGGLGGKGRSVDQPMGTIVGSDRQVALVQPDRDEAIVVQNMENNIGKPVDQPLPPVTTGGNHLLVSMRRNGGAESPEKPMQTIAASGLHHGLLVYNGTPGFARPVGDAMGTVTARDKQALLMPYYGTGVSHPVQEPMGALTGKDRHALVVTEDDIDDCFFRMLKWPELLRGQYMHLMPNGGLYQLTARRKDRKGKLKELTDEQRVKMIGNAVSSTVAAMLGWAVVEVLAA